jgi:hypothetical protein
MADELVYENTRVLTDAEPKRRRAVAQPVLRVIAEAAWITVVYAAASVIVSHRAPLLGPLELLAFVVAGAVLGWWSRRHAEIGPLLLIVGVVLGGAVGWLTSPESRDLLPNLPAAVDKHLAGWLTGVAVLRGALIDTGERAAEDIEKMLRSVPLGLAVIWAYVELAAQPPLWLPFAVSAMWGTVGFLSAAAVSIGLARLTVLHARFADQTQRRAWRVLVALIGFGLVPIAVPIGILSGIPIAAMLNPVAAPLQLVLGVLIIPLQFVIWVLTEIFRPIAGPLGAFLDELQRRMEEQRPQQDTEPVNDIGTFVGLALWGVTIFFVLLAIYYVAQWLLRRKNTLAAESEDTDGDTEFAIVMPESEDKHAGRGRGRRSGQPHDAVAAYLSALAELEEHEELARLPNETPAQHAARVRATAMPRAAEFARLAAAYQLARYGERRITLPENVRSINRFQRLRRALRATNA